MNWKKEEIKKLYPKYTKKQIAKKLKVSEYLIGKVAKELNLVKTPLREIEPSDEQREFIIANEKISYIELARELGVPSYVAKRWYDNIHGQRKKKEIGRFESKSEIEEHYHILCMWYLRGFSIQDILISYSGELAYDEVEKAITYENGAIFKRCYKKIKFAGNDVSINDSSELGMILKEKVRKWDEYLSRFERGDVLEAVR